MKLSKKLGVLGLSIMMAMSFVGCSNSNNAATKKEQSETEKKEVSVIATVNGVEIKSDKLDAEMAYAESMAMAIFGEEYKENEDAVAFLESQKQSVINYLIEDELITQELKNFDVAISDEQVDKEFLTVKEAFEVEGDFEKALSESNLTEDGLKANIRKSLEVQAMVAELTKDIVIDDAAVKAYYDENIESYTTGAGAEMSHILVETQEEAKKVKEEYTAGTPFGELAAKYGTDGTKDIEGALGFVEYEDTGYDADFLAGAKKLKEGEVSAPVKSQFGYHLIKVDNIVKEEKVKPFEEVKEEIKYTLNDAEKNAILEAKIKEWKAASEIVIAE